MFKPFSKSSRQCVSKGYTLVELMVAVVLSLLFLGLTFTLTGQLNNTGDLAGTMADVNENLRAGVNMVARDMSNSGAEIPFGGIPIPNGGTATAINRPGPGVNNLVGTFPASYTTLPVITPGDGLGPTQGSGGTQFSTDIVNIITVNPLSQLDQKALKSVSYTNAAGTITVDPTTCGWGSPAAACPAGFLAANAVVTPGQLIMLVQGNSSCLLTATAVNTTTGVVTFTKGDAADTLGLNQFAGPTGGTLAQLLSGSPPATVTYAYHLSMVTYFLDTSTPRRLMRLVGTGCTNPPVATCPAASTGGPQAVALGINVLQFAYSTSPLSNPDPTDKVPAVGPCTPSPCPGPAQIRKVNLWMIAEADHRNRGTGQYYSKSIATSVTIQNLAYFNKY